MLISWEKEALKSEAGVQIRKIQQVLVCLGVIPKAAEIL